jgi:hypothetical protein
MPALMWLFLAASVSHDAGLPGVLPLADIAPPCGGATSRGISRGPCARSSIGVAFTVGSLAPF